MAVETRPFQAEVSRLLDIVAHSLYSDREVFLRELISNASDACDRLRYRALTEPELGSQASYRILLQPNVGTRSLTISDSGIGMDAEELAENLGTIARSGTARFVAQLEGEARSELSQIGQFGVGFYAAFMVADQVEVISRKAGTDQAHRWQSDGRGGFTIEPAERSEPGTTIILHLREDAAEFAEDGRLRRIVQRYSDHIALPIVLKSGEQEETLNSASALWTRSRSEISPDQALQFYHHLQPGMDEPFATIHIRTEGALEYASLLFVPGAKPFDLFNPERRHGVKLYVRRVFITDECKDLVPGYLRFLRGVVDSSDLPLNVSREVLQDNPMIAKIRGNLTKKTLAEIEKQVDQPGYAAFWDNFGAVLKEGLYEDFENRDQLFRLARFRTTHGDSLTTLADYVQRMKPGQEAIYTLSGEDPAALLTSPQLEGFRAKGVEVLLLTDPIDEFWLSTVTRFQNLPFKSVTRGGADLSKIEGGATPEPVAPTVQGEIATLIASFKLTLGDAVKDVRTSVRLTDSAVCLVADEGDMDLRMEKLLRQHKQLDQASRRVLEINPHHPLVAALIGRMGQPDSADLLAEAAHLLLDQARILEGENLPDPAGFARRLASALARGLGGPAPADLAA